MTRKLENVPDELLMQEVEKRGIDLLVNKVLTKLTGKDDYEHAYKQMLKIFIVCTLVFSVIVLLGAIMVSSTLREMKTTYIQETDKMLLMNSRIENAAAWEKLNSVEKKEKLRNQYYTIIKYYTASSDVAKSLNNDQILDSFNALWMISEKYNTVNFFLPLAYIRVTSNFNPLYSDKSKEGLGALFMIDYERFSTINTSDPITRITYRGMETARNPTDAIKLLYLKMDYLYNIFNGRVDWVLFSLLNNEFDVIQNYWKNGEGEIPDEFYLKGPLYDALNYYHSFINWQIPKD